MMMLKTLFIGTLGGVGAFFLGLPIPWLLGSLIAVCGLRFSGVSLSRPHKKLDRSMRVLIGVALGSSVATNISGFSVELLITILTAIVFVTLITVFGTQYFLRLSKFKAIDGFMSSLPGGLSFLIALSGDLGERFPKIALIHTVRVVFLVFTFSVLALFLEVDDISDTVEPIFWPDINYSYWPLLVLIFTCGLIAEKSKVAGSHVLFSLVLSTVIYHVGWVDVPMPEIVKVVAMIVFGSLLGYELSRKPDSSYFQAIFSSITFTFAVMLAGLVFALVMAEVFDMHYLIFLLALAPGGCAEISLIALALGFDVGFIASVHACRFAFIMLVGPVGLHLSTRKNNR